MDKTCGRVVAIVPAGADPSACSREKQASRSALLILGSAACLRAALLALATYGFGVTAWRARREPGDLAFVAGAYVALAALHLCLRSAERLAPDAPAGERRRLQVAVWALSAVLSCAFAYRISLILPAALVIIVWCMTSLVVLMGFFMLVICKGQQYQGLDDADCDVAGDEDESFKKIRPTEELVKY